MNVVYDRKTDTLQVQLKSTAVAECNEDKPGIILDFDTAGDLVAIEIPDASKRVADVDSMLFRVAS